MGAYQATMGDITTCSGRGQRGPRLPGRRRAQGYYIEETIRGQNIRDVLSDIQYSEFELVKMVKEAADAQVKAAR